MDEEELRDLARETDVLLLQMDKIFSGYTANATISALMSAITSVVEVQNDPLSLFDNLVKDGRKVLIHILERRAGKTKEPNPDKKQGRPEQPSDQRDAEKGYTLIAELIENHPEINLNCWAGSVFTTLVELFIQNDFPYEMFCEEMDKVKEHYRQYFEAKKQS
jgi:hypothetical protein